MSLKKSQCMERKQILKSERRGLELRVAIRDFEDLIKRSHQMK